uniref:Uncharacterized protein n=1 Tax=Arundo donax TaxID=35708 RepID=A0A0A9B828_ARUDO
MYLSPYRLIDSFTSSLTFL